MLVAILAFHSAVQVASQTNCNLYVAPVNGNKSGYCEEVNPWNGESGGVDDATWAGYYTWIKQECPKLCLKLNAKSNPASNPSCTVPDNTETPTCLAYAKAINGNGNGYCNSKNPYANGTAEYTSFPSYNMWVLANCAETCCKNSAPAAATPAEGNSRGRRGALDDDEPAGDTNNAKAKKEADAEKKLIDAADTYVSDDHFACTAGPNSWSDKFCDSEEYPTIANTVCPKSCKTKKKDKHPACKQGWKEYCRSDKGFPDVRIKECLETCRTQDVSPNCEEYKNECTTSADIRRVLCRGTCQTPANE